MINKPMFGSILYCDRKFSQPNHSNSEDDPRHISSKAVHLLGLNHFPIRIEKRFRVINAEWLRTFQHGSLLESHAT